MCRNNKAVRLSIKIPLYSHITARRLNGRHVYMPKPEPLPNDELPTNNPCAIRAREPSRTQLLSPTLPPPPSTSFAEPLHRPVALGSLLATFPCTPFPSAPVSKPASVEFLFTPLPSAPSCEPFSAPACDAHETAAFSNGTGQQGTESPSVGTQESEARAADLPGAAAAPSAVAPVLPAAAFRMGLPAELCCPAGDAAAGVDLLMLFRQQLDCPLDAVPSAAAVAAVVVAAAAVVVDAGPAAGTTLRLASTLHDLR
mgnify:CR=1 FL=1